MIDNRDQERSRFLNCLLESGNVRLACEGSGLPPSTAYRWRSEDADFAEKWDEAIFRSSHPLTGKRWKKALKGQHKRSDPKYVYLLRDSWRGYVKIGVAKDIDSRFRDLQNACPQELTIAARIRTDRADEIEKMLHRRFADQHYRGEWFALEDADIQMILDEYEK